MRRRDFFGAAAAVAAAGVVRPEAASAAYMPMNRIDVSTIKVRKTGKVDIAYYAPHAKPNGLQATKDGLWIMDQGSESYITLVNWADGKPIRDFKTAPDVVGASGLTVDPDNVMWVTATHNNLHVTVDPQDGRILGKYYTPGATRIYPRLGDPPAATSPLPAAPPFASAAGGRGGGRGGSGGRGGRGGSGGRGGRGGGRGGELAMTTMDGAGGTGAHGIENRDGLLYFACPPSRLLYVLDPKTWIVQDAWPLPGNRPHGVAWDGDTLWVADSNYRMFFRHDYKTGKILERIVLTEKDPLIHGATSRGDGILWYCDDQGYICNLKLTA
jgi:sugar lactone lactonase YvrE